MDKRLCRIRDYALFYLYETAECNTPQLGVFVTDVTIMLAIETPPPPRDSSIVIAVLMLTFSEVY